MANNSEIKRTMKLVIDAVDEVPHVDEAVRRDLRRLFTSLRDILTRLPEARWDEAEMVADQAKEFLASASLDRLNQTMIRSSSLGLRQAAERLDDIAPRVLILSRQATNLFS
ncbi:MAG: hypothetical protein O2967_04505 [Proteobacteria bacterium]|nr:hypothetical protein [Pseudomonadota bacterium]